MTNRILCARGNSNFRNSCFRGLRLGFFIFLIAVPTFAQEPAWYRGLQLLNISMDECKSRARGALVGEGYSIKNEVSSFNGGDYFVAGPKDAIAGVIACDAAEGGRSWVNMFLSSSARNTAYLDDERTRLQTRMGQPNGGNTGGPSEGGLTGRWTYQDGPFSDNHVFHANGTVSSTSSSTAAASWSVVGSELIVRWMNGWENRYQLPAVSGQLSGTAIGPNGQRIPITLTRQ